MWSRRAIYGTVYQPACKAHAQCGSCRYVQNPPYLAKTLTLRPILAKMSLGHLIPLHTMLSQAFSLPSCGGRDRSFGVATIREQQFIGKIIGGCTLQQLIGRGGSSLIYLAQQDSPERQVAVKVFLPRSTMDLEMQKDFYRRFLHEAHAASELDHAHILPIYSYGEQDGLPYIIMPYMPGGTLYSYVSKHGPLPLSEAQLYLQQIASALDYAHEHRCVHCDVKPANILLDDKGQIMLSDFGIARAMQVEQSGPLQAAKTSAVVMGTPNYISPEQALGQPVSGRSDVYSLGVTLFFLLIGHPPFRADSSIAMALLHVYQAPPSLFSLRADLSAEIDRIVSKALAKSPDDRFQSAGEFSVAFAEAISTSGSLIDVTDKQKSAASSGRERVNALSRPTIHITSVGVSPSPSRPLWIAGSVLLLVLLGTALIAGLVSSRTHLPTSPRVGSDNGVLADSLAQNQQAWPTSSTFFFVNGHYHIQNKSARNVALALYANYSFSNLRLTVTTSQVHGLNDGADYYGIVMRSTADQSHYYLFEVVAWNGGQYAFLRYDGQYRTLATGSAHALLSPVGQSNTITIEAIGNTFHFFINGAAVGSALTDSSSSALTSGEIGLYVEEQHAEITFSDLHIDPL